MATKHDHISKYDPPVIRDTFVITDESRGIIPICQAQTDSHQAAQLINLDPPARPIPWHTPAHSPGRSMRKLRTHPYRNAQLANTVASPTNLKFGPSYSDQAIALGRRDPGNLSRDSPRDRRPIQNLFVNPNPDTHLDHTLYSPGLLVPTQLSKMAKSMRSKAKRTFRRHKREDGVYAAADAARLERLSAKLVAKISADKDGDQAMEEEEHDEQQVEVGGGEHSGHRLCDVNASGACVLVIGGLNNMELVYFMSFDEVMEDGGGEVGELDYRMASSSQVYDDGDVEMVDFFHCPAPPADKDTMVDELCLSMSRLSLVDDGDIEMVTAQLGLEHDTKLEESTGRSPAPDTTGEEPCARIRTLRFDASYPQVAYDDFDDGSSVGDETQHELITPAQPPLDNPDEWSEDEPLFQYEHWDPFTEVVYVHTHLVHAGSRLDDLPGDDKRVDYPSLFQGDVPYESSN